MEGHLYEMDLDDVKMERFLKEIQEGMGGTGSPIEKLMSGTDSVIISLVLRQWGVLKED